MAKISFVKSGGGTPSGSNGQVQFNDNGSFGADPGLTFNKTTGALTVSGSIVYSPENQSDWDAVPSTLRQAVDYLAAGSGSIASGSIQSYHIAAGAIGSSQIQAGAISTTELSLSVLNVLPSDTQAVAMAGTAGTPSDTNKFVTQQGGSFTGPVTFTSQSNFYSTTNFAPTSGSTTAFTVYSSQSNSPVLVTNTTTNGPTMVFYTSGAYNNTGSGQTVAVSGSSITFANGPTYNISPSSTTNITPTNISIVNPAVPTYPSFLDYSSRATSGGSINVSFLTAGGMTFGATNPTGSLSGSLTLSAAAAASGGGTTIVSSGSSTGLIPLTLSASAVNVSGGGMVVPSGITGSLFGTASYALNADLLDGRDSTSFAGLTANVFTGVQTFTTPVTGTTAYFSGGISASSFSGSLTKLSDGSSFLVAGNGVTLSTGSNGAVTITAGGGEYIPAQFFVEGTIPLFVGTNRSYVYKACTVSSLVISANTAPSGSAINIRINKNGSSLVTGSLAAGSNYQKTTGLNASLAEGDYLTLDVTQVGSAYPGYDLTLKVIAG